VGQDNNKLSGNACRALLTTPQYARCTTHEPDISYSTPLLVSLQKARAVRTSHQRALSAARVTRCRGGAPVELGQLRGVAPDQACNGAVRPRRPGPAGKHARGCCISPSAARPPVKSLIFGIRHGARRCRFAAAAAAIFAAAPTYCCRPQRPRSCPSIARGLGAPPCCSLVWLCRMRCSMTSALRSASAPRAGLLRAGPLVRQAGTWRGAWRQAAWPCWRRAALLRGGCGGALPGAPLAQVDGESVIVCIAEKIMRRLMEADDILSVGASYCNSVLHSFETVARCSAYQGSWRPRASKSTSLQPRGRPPCGGARCRTPAGQSAELGAASAAVHAPGAISVSAVQQNFLSKLTHRRMTDLFKDHVTQPDRGHACLSGRARAFS